MKFDVIRAWKDEQYRQTLNEEESKLLTHVAGEMDESSLAEVCGGEYNDFGGAASASSSNSAFSSRHHSWSLVCDINIFSAEVNVLAIPRLINIGDCETRVCVNND